MEMGKEEIAGKDYVVLMEPVSHLKTQYRSLRRQVYFFQSISALLCFTCCLFTIMYHSYPSMCKENGTNEAPKMEMQRQGRNEMNRPQINTSITRLRVKSGKDLDKYVRWMLTPENLPQNHIDCLTLDKDEKTLEVLHDGTYKVSLQITYRGIEERSRSFLLQHDIEHYTDRYDSKNPLTLLTYMETVNFTSAGWTKSLFSEGIFFLERGDRLKVQTNSPSLIDFSGTLTQKTVFVMYPQFST